MKDHIKNIIKSITKPYLIAVIMFLQVSLVICQGGDCGFGAASEVCSYGWTETATAGGIQWTTVYSAGTGNTCDGNGDAANQDDFPDDQCYYTITVYCISVFGNLPQSGPTQESSTFDGSTCSGYCGG
jgi:hypothetical protein